MRYLAYMLCAGTGWPVGTNLKSILGKKKAQLADPFAVRDSPAFKQLDSDNISFRMSFAREYKALYSQMSNHASSHHLFLARTSG